MTVLKRFSVLSLAILFGLMANLTDIPTAKATCGSYYEDNDDPNGGTYRQGFTTYTKHSGSYRGDYRLSTKSASDQFYQWWSPGGSCKDYVYYYAYLNNVNFTNKDARYSFQISSGGDGLKYVDQYNAPGGWNYVGIGLSDRQPHLSLSSYATSGKTGADGVKFVTK